MTTPSQPLVTLFMSISLNGMIARLNGSEDFFTSINWDAFVDLARRTGALAWGRKTHDIFRQSALAAMPDVLGFVLTSNPAYSVEKGWSVATSPEETIALAQQRGTKELLIVGGARVNAAFAERDLIDRIILDVESVIVGEGIPLCAPSSFDLPLRLRDIKTLSPTVIQLHYDVFHRRAGVVRDVNGDAAGG